MKIKKMNATFGKLKNSKLELGEGLNIVCAPNEYGKSTWCAFIKTMLYGIDTSDRDKIGYLADKTRFRPWDGGAMTGTMEIVHKGQNLTLARKALGNVPMKSFAAMKTGTVDFVKDITAENAGETLTGVSERVFERTAFIRRPDLRVSQTPELEKKISLLVASGEEDVSYTDADNRLRAQLRKLRYNKKGTLPTMEEELAQARLKMETIEKMGDSIAELRDLAGRYDKQIAGLEKDLETHDRLDARNEVRRVVEARSNAKRATETANEIREQLTRNGRVITRGDLAAAREAVAAIEPLREIRDTAVRSAWGAEKELSNAKSRAKLSPLGELTVEEATAASQRAAALEKGEVTGQKPVVNPKIASAIFTFGILMCICSIASLVGINFLPAAAAIAIAALSVVLVAAGVVLTFAKRTSTEDAEAELNGLLNKYGVTDAGGLARLTQEYYELNREIEAASAAAAGAAEIRKNAEKVYADAERDAAERLAELIPGAEKEKDFAAEISRLEALTDALIKAEFDEKSSQSVFETLLTSFSGNIDAPEEYIPQPIRNREDTAAALQRAKMQKAEAERAYNVALGEQRALGDPAVIEGEIESLRERIAAQTRQYNALSMAIDTLSEANTELQTRFSPIISQRAGEILNSITLGRYEKLLFDKSFKAGAKTVDDVVPRDSLALSEGTADEIYLALRLAMCQLILDGDEPCPVILDDALANFDDERCKAALEVLEKLAEERQIIVFTCHKREMEMVKDRNVTVINAHV